MEALKRKIIGQSKRILKRRKPARTIWPDITDQLIQAFNELTSIAIEDPKNPLTIQTLGYCRRKVVKAFVALEVRYIVPNLPGHTINKLKQLRNDDSYTIYDTSDSDLTDDDEPANLVKELKEEIQTLQARVAELEQELKQASEVKQNPAEIEKLKQQIVEGNAEIARLKQQIAGSKEEDQSNKKNTQNSTSINNSKKMDLCTIAKTISSIVDLYDGTPEKRNNYIQQIKIVKEILNESTEKEELITRILTTRIKGDLAIIVSSVTTIDALIAAVEGTVNVPNSANALNTLKMVKPNNNNSSYLDRLKSACTMLLGAYIAEGVPKVTADKLVATALIDQMKLYAAGDLRVALSVVEYADHPAVLKVALGHLSTTPSANVNFVRSSWRPRKNRFHYSRNYDDRGKFFRSPSYKQQGYWGRYQQRGRAAYNRRDQYRGRQGRKHQDAAPSTKTSLEQGN